MHFDTHRPIFFFTIDHRLPLTTAHDNMRSSGAAGGLASLRPAVLGMARVIGMGFSSAAAAPLMARGDVEDEIEGTPLWVLGVASMALVLLGGAFAGLTIAYVASSSSAIVPEVV